MTFRICLGAWLGLCVAAAAAWAQTNTPQPVKMLSWKSIYFFDEDAASLSLHDLHWPGPKCIFALGTQRTRNRVQPVALRSTDDGRTWSQLTLKDYGRSAFFLSERLGYLVTESGVERTSDCGTTWEKLGRKKGLLRVHMRDESVGWAVGVPKLAVATRDGGRTWTDLKIANTPTSDPKRSLYAWIEFAGEKLGTITGWHSPQRTQPQFPVWMEPDAAAIRRQWPSLTLVLQTSDGGATWQGLSASVMGHMTRVRMLPNGNGLALMEFEDTFEWPAEVHRLAGPTITRVYRDKRHAVTDLAIKANGEAYLGGVEPQGVGVRLPIPGKVRILRSLDLKLWTEDPADYRAVANRVMLAKGPGDRLMAATDTGMILRLE